MTRGLSTALRWAKYTVGSAEAVTLALLGWWLWVNAVGVAIKADRSLQVDALSLARGLRLAGLGLFAAGQFCFVFLVANDVCRRAPAALTGGVEWAAGALALVALVMAAGFAWAALA